MRLTPTHALRSALLALVLVSCTSDRAVGPDAGGAARGTVVSNATTLVITEVMPDPSKVADTQGEWFEVYNAGPDTVDLKGYKLVSGPTVVTPTTTTISESHTITSDVLVAPGDYAVLGNNTNTATNGGVPEDYSYGTSLTLNNSNTDWLTIKTPTGVLADSVAYSASTVSGTTRSIVAPTFAPSAGTSRALIDLTADNAVMATASWVNSATTYGLGDRGTPGQPNTGGAVAAVTPRISWVTPGTTFRITASAADADGKPSATNFTWSVDNTAIATIDPVTGVATGVSLGVATVTATASNGVKGSAPLFVVAPGDVSSISISTNDPARLPAGYTMPAFPTSKTTTGATVTPTLVWSSADPTVAMVDALGYTTGVAAGATKIRATAPDGVYGEFLVTIEPADAPTTAVYRDHLAFGTPHDADPTDDFIVSKRQYVLSYNKSRGGPNWVSWDLNASQFSGAPRCNCFSADASLPADVYHVVDFDYRNGGYDRGHMVQSESRTTTDQENAATFLLTNILPQAAANNQGPWSKFENYLNDLARDSAKEVYLVAGGIYAPNAPTLKGEGHVAIPDYTWKVAVILNAGAGLADVHSASDLRVVAVKMPNLTEANANSGDPDFAGTNGATGNIHDRPWQDFVTTVAAIQSATGYDVLDALPDDIEVLVEHDDKHAPVATLAAPSAADEGAIVTLDASGSSDADGDALSYFWEYGDGTSGTGAAAQEHGYADNGTYVVKVTVSDPAGAKSSATATIVVANSAPTATFVAPSAPFDEGQSFVLTLTGATDAPPDVAAGLRFAFDCGDGAGFGALSATATATCATTDDGVRAVRGRVQDKDGGISDYASTVTVRNAAPVITGLTFTTDPVSVGTPVNVAVAFTDAGSGDTHTTTIAWDDNSMSAAAAAGVGAASATHAYTQAGVYTLTVTVRDDDGGSASVTSQQYVVVYDPSAGFVTGGGWVFSPAGAYSGDHSLTGRAAFGFVARYQKGANVPSGSTEFDFRAGALSFTSTSYQWLVVAGDGRAQYKGTGTIAGRPNSYNFLLTAVDDPSGDRFRIKITDPLSGDVVYDNQRGDADDAVASTTIGGGSIVVHAR